MYTLIPKVSFYFDNHSFRVENTYEVKEENNAVTIQTDSGSWNISKDFWNLMMLAYIKDLVLLEEHYA
ncbi:hypothetical protein SAC12B_0065 [Lactobacillus phage SAC12B]|uniref:Uncharacterized protein n=1 Tax=Lactobacillus phage SAC12B TaxID=2510941 RepID=A0A4Y5FID6_9CAUD|nr:hypothetical protein HWC10_gp065 [Lactobacillus phage SAC12B]QBJ03854.1 hypothetical protein SAC12B_0065 [Lactobacillus phage SAC12B]